MCICFLQYIFIFSSVKIISLFSESYILLCKQTISKKNLMFFFVFVVLC